MKKYILLFFVLIISACTNKESSNTTQNSSKSTSKLKTAKGGKKYGGIFKLNEEEYFRSLYPLNITEAIGTRITEQVYDGLVQYNPKDLTIEGSLAKDWLISPDGKTYTFYLIKGIKFHDDPCFSDGKGREVKAADIKYCFDRWSAFEATNQGYNFIKQHIKGAKEYYKSTLDKKPLPDGCEGIKVIDDYTVEITLNQPFASFLYILGLPFGNIYPKEAVEKYGKEMRVKAVGTGPFFIKKIKENDAVILARNPNYWKKDEYGNQLPYLDGIRVSFVGDMKSSLLNFKKGDLDMVYRLPLEMHDEVLDPFWRLKGDYKKYQLQRKASMTLQYYGFKQFGKLFNDVRLRQAFNYAIDREKLCKFTLKGLAEPAKFGVIPPTFKSYAHKQIRGYKFDPVKAKKLLTQAGFPNGKGFPELSLQLNSGGGRNEQVAEAIQKMINETLNINVKITKMPFAQHLEAIETGKLEFWRAGWVADYPDPENFLSLFWGKNVPEKVTDRSYLNTTRYNNPKFNAMYEAALLTPNDEKRNNLYQIADQVAINDAPIMPIFYPMDVRLLQPYVRNFPQNSMEYRKFERVWLDK